MGCLPPTTVRNSLTRNIFFVRRAEHRTLDDDAPIKSLPYYGGARGKYLLIHPSGRTSITNRNPSFFGLKGEDNDEEDVGMESEGGDNTDESETNSTSGSSGPDESVSVGLPPDNASVAEAKPVGLAIAGPGGVASSRPTATAVVGPGGLALAKPVATAIAGVQGSEQLVGLPGNKKKHERPLKHTNPVAPANKTKQIDDIGFNGRSNNEVNLVEFQSNNIPQGYSVFYVPMYLPENQN